MTVLPAAEIADLFSAAPAMSIGEPVLLRQVNIPLILATTAILFPERHACRADRNSPACAREPLKDASNVFMGIEVSALSWTCQDLTTRPFVLVLNKTLREETRYGEN